MWFRFTEIIALGKSAFKIFLRSEKELLRKCRKWVFLVGCLLAWVWGGWFCFSRFYRPISL